MQQFAAPKFPQTGTPPHARGLWRRYVTHNKLTYKLIGNTGK